MKLTSFVRGSVIAALLAFGLAACDQPASNNNQSQGQPPQSQSQQAQAPTAPAGDPRMSNPSIKGEISTAKNFYFVFDGSGSMSGTIAEAKAAVKAFIKTVPEENVNLGLFIFDGNGTREVVPLGANNRAKFLAEIDRASAGGGTPLGASISTGVQSLTVQYQKQLGYGEYRLIVVTDGESSDSLGGERSGPIGEARRLSVPIYTIGFNIGSTHELRKYSVSYQSANNGKELAKALEQAASELDVYDPADFQQK